MPAGRPAPDPRKVARAGVMRRDGAYLHEIARALGVSTETARSYVRIFEHAEQWVPAYNRAQIVADATGLLEELKLRGLKRLDERGAEFEKVAPVVVTVVREILKIHGGYAPTSVTLHTDEPRPDPEMIRAIREAQAIAARDRAAIDDDTGSGP